MVTAIVALVIIVVQEYRIHLLVERMMLQANIPSLMPARTTAPAHNDTPVVDTRKKLFSVKIPE